MQCPCALRNSGVSKHWWFIINECVSELVYLTSLLNSQGLMSDRPGAGQWYEGWKCPRLEYTGFEVECATAQPSTPSFIINEAGKVTLQYIMHSSAWMTFLVNSMRNGPFYLDDGLIHRIYCFGTSYVIKSSAFEFLECNEQVSCGCIHDCSGVCLNFILSGDVLTSSWHLDRLAWNCA